MFLWAGRYSGFWAHVKTTNANPEGLARHHFCLLQTGLEPGDPPGKTQCHGDRAKIKKTIPIQGHHKAKPTISFGQCLHLSIPFHSPNKMDDTQALRRQFYWNVAKTGQPLRAADIVIKCKQHQHQHKAQPKGHNPQEMFYCHVRMTFSPVDWG